MMSFSQKRLLMLTITNLHPIKAIHSLLQPLGLTLSNKQQVINKVAFAALAILVVACRLATVEAQDAPAIEDAKKAKSLSECLAVCSRIMIGYRTRLPLDLRNDCNQFCEKKWV